MKKSEIAPVIAITESSNNDNPGRSSNSCLKIQKKAVVIKTIITFYSSFDIEPSSFNIESNLSLDSWLAEKFTGNIT